MAIGTVNLALRQSTTETLWAYRTTPSPFFEQGILLPRDGTSHSDQMHLVERFSFDAEESVLFRNYRIEDPRFLVSPVDGQDVMGFSVAPYEPYGCLELSGDNNIRR